MTIVPLSDLTDRVGFVDPAAGRTPSDKKSARAAIVVIGQDAMRRVFVLHAWAARVLPTVLTDMIFRVLEDLHPNPLGVEANAMQSLYVASLLREAQQQGRRLPIRAVHQATTVDKDFRIRGAIQPVLSAGRLFLQLHQRELFQELEAAPGGLTKDLRDALASAIALLPIRPAPQVRSAELEQRVQYLRQSHAPAWYIKQVAASAVNRN